MAHVHTFCLPHYDQYPVHVALFRNLSNAAFLRSQLLEANPAFDYAFLDADMIVSPNHLKSACFHALHHTMTNTLKARTPHSELVFRLHPNNNIGEAYRKFGIADTTSKLIAVKLALSPDVTKDQVADHLGAVVQGDSVPIGDDAAELAMHTDLKKVKTVYKLNEKKTSANPTTDESERKELEAVILGIMTVKGS
ncbi:CGI-121-domain-containing protein [Sporormia fimetaria CBS 119925]|uniref:EKC/KEOPS complex subunit CGI121 n=1 Tax=Sporormia fimetaria CBS 119925 TaxID=1340428 RepID=A0A6A6VHA5_9PLEO|nr:CGI-121-domain-containing protein [Sporormia fimetaria CBS 119925]